MASGGCEGYEASGFGLRSCLGLLLFDLRIFALGGSGGVGFKVRKGGHGARYAARGGTEAG